MSRSILEEEISRRVTALRVRLALHDRGVVLGVLLSLVPIFPVPLIGLALGWFHARAHRAGKLSDFDHGLTRTGLMLAALNTVLSALLVLLFLQLARDTDWTNLITYLPRHALEALRWLVGSRGTGQGGTSI